MWRLVSRYTCSLPDKQSINSSLVRLCGTPSESLRGSIVGCRSGMRRRTVLSQDVMYEKDVYGAGYFGSGGVRLGCLVVLWLLVSTQKQNTQKQNETLAALANSP